MKRACLFIFACLAALSLPVSGDEGKGLDKELKDQVKQSIDKGLKYLESKQNDEGTWSDPDGKPHPGMTAIAVTAMLRSPRGYNDVDDPFVARPIDWLLSLQKEDGGIYQTELQNYITSISLMALVEAKKRFKDPERLARIDAGIEKAKGFVIDLQCDEKEGYEPANRFYGGVGYGSSLRPDLSNTQLAMEALSEAGVPADHPFYKKALKFVERCQNRSESNDEPGAGDDGGFIYHPGKSIAGEYDRPDGTTGLRSYGSMTYAGLKSFLHAGLTPDDPRVKAAYDWITAHYTVEENPELGLQGLFYYYHTFAKAFRVLGVSEIEDTQGGVHDWRADLAAKLVATQKSQDGELGGFWVNDEARWWEGDPVLVTSYAVLALTYTLE
ncbi:MAG: terpene cyclase/mutase family protein [Planctomycetes bacterium]|nr:terpene cyclase/mutase family protein [Planctomycetota bacterium]